MRGVHGFCLAVVLVLGAPHHVFAHAVVTKASLDETPIKAQTPTPVTLYFNTGIEVGFTTVSLLDHDGTARPLDVTEGTKAGTVVVSLPALAAGTYGLRYRVLAADGHVTENLLRFRVVAPE